MFLAEVVPSSFQAVPLPIVLHLATAGIYIGHLTPEGIILERVVFLFSLTWKQMPEFPWECQCGEYWLLSCILFPIYIPLPIYVLIPRMLPTSAAEGM